MKFNLDVLCVGHASYDLVFSVAHQPGPDEKTFATSFISCGGGPAANAAVTVSRLRFKSAFAGYLGNGYFGQRHFEEFRDESVITDFIIRNASPTPLSTVLVKPQGQRTLVNYQGDTKPLPATSIDFSGCHPKVILFDGHEPYISLALMEGVKDLDIITVLDAESVHQGTQELLALVDYVVASEKFASDFTGEKNPQQAVLKLSTHASAVVITLGEAGLVWKNDQGAGTLPAFLIDAVDTTGAGDAFHGAFAAGLASGKSWQELLRYSSAVGALCCTRHGARPAIPRAKEVSKFLKNLQ